MKYKLTEIEDWIVQIDSEGNVSPSFTNKGEIGKQMWAEYQTWLSEGNTVEPLYTTEEQKVKDAEDAEIAKNAWIGQRQAAYLEAGLTFEYWNEINIEEDQTKIDKYKVDRNAIRTAIPKSE